MIIMSENNTPEITTIKKKNPLSSTIKYYGNASQVYRQNFWKFFVVGLIAGIITNLAEWVVQLYFDGKFGLVLPTTELDAYILYFAIRLLIAMVINGFYGAILGMGFDIMGSGDNFAQLRNFFYYVRKYWFQYFLLGFIVNFLVYLQPFIDYFLRLNTTTDYTIRLNYLVHAYQMVVYLFFYIFNPALMCYSNFSEAFRNTRKIFKKYFLKILSSYLIYYFLFFVPLLAVKFVYLGIQNDFDIFEYEGIWYIGEIFNKTYYFYSSDLTTFIRNFSRVFWFWRFIIGYPFLSLVSSRINNEYQFEQNPDNFK